MARNDPVHIPVLADEVVQWLRPESDQILLDGTLGAGGHSRLLADRVGTGGRVIALDRDPEAVAGARVRLAGLPVQPVHADFRDIASVLGDLNVRELHGMVLDLGLSSDQLADRERGFSFDADGPLDLRFDPTVGEPAWRLIDRLDARRLADLVFQLGEERFSRRIARRIVETRRNAPIRTAAQLAAIVRRCVPRAKKHSIDPATRTFQALRIAVNDELGALETVLEQAPNFLAPTARLAVISFHSLEDRRVKHAFRGDPRYMVLTKKPIRPIQAEIQRNPRSRSAKLRVAERCPISE